VRCGLSLGSADQLYGSPAFLFLSRPLHLGQGQRSVRCFPAVSVLCWFADYFWVLPCHLTLDVVHCLRRWAFCTAVCPISGNRLSLAHCWPVCLTSLCLVKVSIKISSLPLSPSQVHLEHPAPSVVCSFSFPCLFFSFFFFFAGQGSVCSGGYAGLSQGWLWEYHLPLICSPVGLLDVS
jgi:hypothetical protein